MIARFERIGDALRHRHLGGPLLIAGQRLREDATMLEISPHDVT